MTYACIKAGAALLVLGGFAIATPALAVSPPAFAAKCRSSFRSKTKRTGAVARSAPDVTPPEAAVGNDDALAPKEEMKERPKEDEGGAGNAEEKALKEDGLIPE